MMFSRDIINNPSENNAEKTEELKKHTEKRKLVQLPLTRVKTIMKMPNEVQNVSQCGLYLVTKATELFIQYLAKKTNTQRRRKLEYDKLADVIQTDQTLEFLRQYLPKKITFKKFKEIIAAKQEKEEIDSQDSDLSNNCVFDYSSQTSSDETFNISSPENEY